MTARLLGNYSCPGSNCLWRASLVSLNHTKRTFQFSTPARFGITKSSLGVVPFAKQTIYLYARLRLTKDRSTSVGAVLTGSVYVAGNGSVVWTGFGFSATGPYNCAFALSGNGSTADGYYTYTDQKNGNSPAGETGPWLLQYYREPTWGECALVYRGFTAKDYETGCTASSE
jgi:hypothetical protein